MPILKNEIAEKLRAFYAKRVNDYMGAINEVPRCFIKEGNRAVRVLPGGQIDEIELKRASVDITVSLKDVPHLSLSDRMDKFDKAAQDTAKQINKHSFDQIMKALEQGGNIVDSRKELSAEACLEAVEKMHLDFDDNGNPRRLTVVVPPNMRQQAEKALEDLHNNPEHNKRYHEIILKKRIEWRDREALRRLVG